MSPGRHLFLDERGVALPLAMIVLVALTMMVLASLTLAGVEPQISQNLTDTARARYLAESGVEWAFRQLAASPVEGASPYFAASLLTGPDGRQNTADDQQPTGVPGQNTAAMLTTLGAPSPLPTRTLAEGTYAVKVERPGTVPFSVRDAGDEAVDSDVDPGTGLSHVFFSPRDGASEITAGLDSRRRIITVTHETRAGCRRR